MLNLQEKAIFGIKSDPELFNLFPTLERRVASTAEKRYLELTHASIVMLAGLIEQGTDPRWIQTLATKSGQTGLNLGGIDVLFLREDQISKEIAHVLEICGEGGISVEDRRHQHFVRDIAWAVCC
jgi:hypothetical protein